jgi:SPRY domain
VDDSCDVELTSTTNYTYNNGFVWDASVHKYTVTVDKSSNMSFWIGFAPSKLFDISESNHTVCGWYLYLKNGALYSQNGDNNKPYRSGCKVGDTITCIYNASTSDISFEKNGVSLGVAYTHVSGEDIAPAAEMINVGDSITLFSGK